MTLGDGLRTSAVTLLDTADFYGAGRSELLIGRALRDVDREQVQISAKFGALRDPDGAFVGIEGRPAHVKGFLAYTLRRLGTDHVDVYRPARLDPAVPIEDTVGAIAELVQAGHVRHVGLSEVGPETIRRAHAVHPVSDLQIEYSLFSRGIEGPVLDTCRELGIGVTAYGVLAQAPDIVALVGARRPGRIPEAAAELTLSAADLAAIAEAVPAGAVAGERYAAPLLAMLDSER